jgi:hypothetical protein
LAGPGRPHPDPEQVARTIARGYRNPSLSSVRPIAERSPGSEARHWTRLFDGVDIVGTNAVTVGLGQAWQTRWYPEIHEPAPIRRSAVISEAQARANAGVEPSGTKSTTRLVYVAVFKQIYKVPNPMNAMDVENVIDCYRPAIEARKLDHDGDIAYVDAYTGDIVQRIAHPNWVN